MIGLVLLAVCVLSLLVGMACGAFIATADHEERKYEEALESLRRVRGG